MFSFCTNSQGIVALRKCAGVGIADSEKGGILCSPWSMRVHVPLPLLIPLGAETGGWIFAVPSRLEVHG